MIYLDANVFVMANLNAEAIGDKARSLLRDVQTGKVDGCTSALTFDELVWAVKKNRTKEDAVLAGEAFLNMPSLKLVAVSGDLLAGALSLMKEHRLDPRDAIHAASALNEGAKSIVSADRHFDKLKGFKRKDISEIQ
jgi:predicted nucleic acid-binding protein